MDGSPKDRDRQVYLSPFTYLTAPVEVPTVTSFAANQCLKEAHMWKWCVRGSLAALAVVVFAAPVLAQGSATSSITGIVVDGSGGVIPGATISVKSESTGAEFTAISNSQGAFTINAVNVGSYTVTVTLQGFKQAVLKGVSVSTGAPATV